MSGFYGYPNGYGANTYPQNYVAQQQQAYLRQYEYQQNAAAAAYNPYRTMQQQQQQSAPGATNASQQMPKYDYSGMSQAQQDLSKSYYYHPTNGYDAAVYSAASSLMQQQQTNAAAVQQAAASKWQTVANQMAGAMGKAAAAQQQQQHQHQKPQTFKRRNPTSNAQVFYCEVCKISCAGPQTYKEHLDGQKHKKREQAVKLSQNAQTGSTSQQISSSNRSHNIIRCELCDVSCTGRDAYAAHIRGTKHQKTIKLHQKLGKPIPPDVQLASSSMTSSSANTIASTATATSSPNKPPTINSTSNQVVISAPPVMNPNAVAAQKTKTTNVTSPSKVSFVAGAALKTTGDDKTAGGDSTQPQQTSTTTTTTTTSTSNIPKLFDINTTGFSTSSLNTMISGGGGGGGGAGGSESGDLMQCDENSQNSMEADVEPVGPEYIEFQNTGKIITFYCKLCDCKFNDPNAKDMHLKGRRHRLAYKKKVDPSLRVEMKNLRKNSLKAKRDKKIKAKQEEHMRQQMKEKLMQAMSIPSSSSLSKRHESIDDRHVLAKHTSIYPTDEEIHSIQEIIVSCEKALKLVSDEIADQDARNGQSKLVIKQEPVQIKEEPKVENQVKTEADTEKPAEGTTNTAATTTTVKAPRQEAPPADDQTYRALKGVMRVGLLAKGLLLKGDSEVQLVVLCSEKPTKALFNRVYDLLREKIKVVSSTDYTLIKDIITECICVKTNADPIIICKIYLTSPMVREDNVPTPATTQTQETTTPASTGDSTTEQQSTTTTTNTTTATTTSVSNNSNSVINDTQSSADLLDKQNCLESLATLRHAKWFQARACSIQNCVLTIRILRDLCRRIPTWRPLSQWALELLVEKSLGSANQMLSPGEALRRVLECISSGILLPNGPGIYDPCEKVPVDATENLKSQEREEITSSAQMALRLLAFKQIHKILGMDSLASKNPRKRQRDHSENEANVDEKKEKKDENSTPTPPTTTTTGLSTASSIASSIPSLLSVPPPPPPPPPPAATATQ